MNLISQLAHLFPPVLLKLWGPLNVNAYGLFILVGVGVFFACVASDPWRSKIISVEKLYEVIVIATFVGIIGGRVLYALFQMEELESIWSVFALWQGGFSVLGSVIAIGIFMSIYLRYAGIAVLPLLDLASMYAPLLQAIARLGCFFAGCCYGVGTDVAWAVVYDHPDSCAPIYQQLHPTQLYSVLFFLVIFITLRFLRPRLTCRQGQWLMLYLIFMGFERFLVDFLRADRLFYPGIVFSVYQLLALMISALGIAGFLYLVKGSQRRLSEHF